MNHEQIEGFAALFGAVPKLTEIEIRHEGISLRLRRNGQPATPVAPTPLPLAPSASSLPPSPTTSLVHAEHVGVFHTLPVALGQQVKQGQPLGQIDTMRLLSDCKASVAGTLTQILVDEGQAVEYGQPLFELTPEDT
jgi:biotin carboxyl carrier protein